MDDNSSNDTEKRNWRERLGIGAKDMPKIAGEFAKPADPVLVLPTSKRDFGNDGAAPVVVAKPAPMAPRVAAKPAPVRQTSAQTSASRPMQPAAPQSPDVLAERLRNQREAAEKLAEQRVANAKDRAEANKAAQQQPQQSAQPSPQRQQPPGRGKPKFSFADEEARGDAKRDPRAMPPIRPTGPVAQPTRSPPPSPALSTQSAPPPSMQPQLAPARPPLGGAGDRFINPQAPQPTRQPPPSVAGSGFPPPPYRPNPPPSAGYRPIDPATSYPPPPSFQMPRGAMAPPPGAGPRPPAMSGGMAGQMAGDPRLQSGPYIADPYGAPPGQSGGIPRYDQMGGRPPPPLRNDHLRPQTHSYEGDMQDDIFEDAPAAKPRRASSSDYSQAYHNDGDMDYAPRRRSGGPLMLLMLLGVAAAVGIGGVLYYQNMLKTGPNGTAEQAPVVAPPGEPAKTTAETPAAGGSNSVAQPTKKQIYDRIVGEREVLGGQVTPTEEAPVQPSLDQTTQPAALPQPATGASDEPLPLPMPPPVNNSTQGSTGGAAPAAATASAEPIPQPASPDATVTATGYNSEQQQQMAAASQQQTLIEEPPAAAPAQADAEEATEPPPAKPAAKKAAAKPKPKKKVDTASAKQLGTEPVVLVAPEDEVAITQDPSVTLDGEPVLQGAAPTEQPVKKKKTLLGLFTGENKTVDSQNEASGIDAATEQQVAAVNTPRATTTKQVAPEQPAQPSAAARTGFTLQLASFASEQEARAEYQRIASKHSGTVSGLSPIVAPVSVGGSTRYRLSLGTVSSSTQAAGLCKDLLASGLRDCSVRRR